jgi:hypothetical protein
MIYSYSTDNASYKKAVHKSAGWVYFTHCKHIGDVYAQRQYYKIGTTSRVDLKTRIDELRGEYKALSDFKIDRAIWVPHAEAVERSIHQQFDKYRVNRNREFFDVCDKIDEVMGVFDIAWISAGDNGVEWNAGQEYTTQNLPGCAQNLPGCAQNLPGCAQNLLGSAQNPLGSAQNPLGSAQNSVTLSLTDSVEDASAMSDLTETTAPQQVYPVFKLKQKNKHVKQRIVKAKKIPVVKKTSAEAVEFKYKDLKPFDGLEVITPELCFTPDRAKSPQQTLTMRAKWAASENVWIDETGCKHARLCDFAAHHCDLLGWKGLSEKAKCTTDKLYIVHTPGKKPTPHGPTYGSYSWKRFCYENSLGKLCPVEELIYI